MKRECPAPADLGALLVGDDAAAAGITRHVRDCAVCRHELDQLRAAAAAVRAHAVLPRPTPTSCLGEDGIAALADAEADEADAATLAHLATCARCAHRLTTVARLLRDDRVAAELRRLDAAAGGPTHRRPALAHVLSAAALAAAAVVGVILLPPRFANGPAVVPDGTTTELHRESAITTTVAPRIVGPATLAADGDSLRWTSVPHADRYEVKFFDREGTLVWHPWTRDTVLAIPEHLLRGVATTYLWKVEARTGWDRWVSSEWADLTIGVQNRQR